MRIAFHSLGGCVDLVVLIPAVFVLAALFVALLVLAVLVTPIIGVVVTVESHFDEQRLGFVQGQGSEHFPTRIIEIVSL